MGWRKRDFLYAIVTLAGVKAGSEMVEDSQDGPTLDSSSNGDDVPSTLTPTPSPTTPEPTLEPADPPRVDMSVTHRASRPNQIEFNSSIEITDGIQSLSLNVFEQTHQVEFQGLSEQTSTYSGLNGEENESVSYEWDGESSACQLKFVIDVTNSQNDTFDGRDFAGTENWIFAPTPGFTVSWSDAQTESFGLSNTMYPIANRTEEHIQIDVNKPAKLGEELIYIGELEEHSRIRERESFSLVVPTHADPPPLEDISQTLEFASDRLQVGELTDKIVAFVTTDPIRRGGVNVRESPFKNFETSVSEFWFHESASLNSPNNSCVHEYVHTRQNLALDEEMEWFREASAEYYAARIMYASSGGLSITKSDVTEHLYPDQAYANEILARKSEWSGPRVPYRKGGYVLLALDEIIRDRSDNSSYLQEIFYYMNSRDEVSYPQFVDLASESASIALDDWCDRYVRGSEVPPVPDGWERENLFDDVGTLAPDE